MNTTLDPYKIMGLSKSFSYQDLKSQFKKLVLKYHPDKTIDITSTSMFQTLSHCYKVLLHDLKKRELEKPHHELKQGSIDFLKSQSPTQNIHLPQADNHRKFDVEKFNKVFDKTRLGDLADDGYEQWMNDPSSFDRKNNMGLIKYEEPSPLLGGTNSELYYELGVDKISDFSSAQLSNRSLNYMDYRIAHTTQTLVDESTIDPRKQYKTVKDLEHDRSNLSFEMSPYDVKKIHEKQMLNLGKEENRKRKIEEKDSFIEHQFNKINSLGISFYK